MMTIRQHLLLKLAEECQEVAQRALKSVQFGANEVQTGQEKSNATRLRDELNDLDAVILLIESRTDDIALMPSNAKLRAILDKQTKIEKYLTYSQELGMVGHE